MTIAKSITINGAGSPNLSISGGGTIRPFTITIGAVLIENLSIINGGGVANGGGVSNAGALTLTNDTITGNVATSKGGGVYSTAAITLSNDTISNNTATFQGGGTFISNTSTITNTTISDNSLTSTAPTDLGGGMYNSGALTMSDCTIANNVGNYNGGGLYTVSGATTISNSTFFGNSTLEMGGGIYRGSGTVILNSDTISGNISTGASYLGGGFFGTYSQMNNTIVAGNTAANDPDGDGTITTGNFDLIGVSTGVAIGTNTSCIENVSSGLATSLANNNFLVNTPSTTQTLALLIGSPALGAGYPTFAGTTSQNNIVRPATPSIGAYQAPPLPAVTPNLAGILNTATSLTIDGTNFDATAANDVVTFDNGVSGTVATATTTSLVVNFTGGLSSLPNATVLHASVTDSVTGFSGTSAPVATVETPTAPTITTNTANLLNSETTLTINGTNFDPTATNDTVVFNLGAVGTVTTATATQLVVTFSAQPNAIGNLTAVITTDGVSSGNPVQVATVVEVTTFQVTSTTLLSGDNGFLVTFNAAYTIAQLDLYNGASGGTLPTRSVQITGPNGAAFGGTSPDTMRFNAVPVDSTQLELILTGINHVEAAQVLAPGSFTVTLDGGSSDPAFERLSDDAYLDGNGEGTITPVDNYTTTITVSAIPANTDVVSIGDLVAGAGQTVSVPLVLSGGSGSVNDTTSVSLTISAPADGAYTVTGFTVNNLMIAGVSANFTPTSGLLTISSAIPFATTDNPLLLGYFTFVVSGLGNPGTAPGIDTKTPINITVTNILDDASNPKPFVGVNGFHVSAYLGNLSAPIGVYNSTDVSQLQGLILSTVKAFALYPDVDPMLLADVNKDGTVNSSDVSQLQARILGLPSTIPALPLGASGVAVNGADPVLFVGSSYTPNGLPANLGNLTPGSTVLVPLSVFVTDPHGVNVTAAETAFSFDPKVFTLNGVSAGAIANGNLGGNPFSIAFAEVSPGEVNLIGSSNFGPNLAYGQTATLFLVSLTVRSNAPAAGTEFNLMSSAPGFQTGLQDNQGRTLVLSSAPDNRAGDNLDGYFTVHSGKPLILPESAPTKDQKQASSVTGLSPEAWDQFTTLLFEAPPNQSVLSGSNGGLAVTAALPTTLAVGKKQTDSVESLQGVAWEHLTTVLFETAATENDLCCKGGGTF